MNRQSKEYVIFDSVTPQAITSSTDATPIVVTKASHGLATGDLVLIYGHTTNVAANGIRKVTRVDANTFSLQDPYSGSNIAGSGAGAGGASGIFMTAPKVLLVEDFRDIVLYVNTAGTATTTIKFAGSLGLNLADQTAHGDTPIFGATVSDTNPYNFVAVINLEDGAQIEGDTGLVVAGTDVSRSLEVNVNGLKYFTVVPISWTQGAITVKAKLFNDK